MDMDMNDMNEVKKKLKQLAGALDALDALAQEEAWESWVRSDFLAKGNEDIDAIKRVKQLIKLAIIAELTKL